MKRTGLGRRLFMVAGTAALLGACSIIPKGPRDTPAPEPSPSPTGSSLPGDAGRHRIALLVPLSGDNAAVGQSIANATTMALLDTNAQNLRITSYDTAKGPEAAARQAIADGNRLILGPMLGTHVASIAPEARRAKVPLITFSNDTGVAASDIFVMGHIPEQSIDRSVAFLRTKGARDFAILAPDGEYGQRAEASLRAAVLSHGGRVTSVERYARSNTSVISAAQRLRGRAGYDSVLIADNARTSAQAAAELRPAAGTRLFGTELWSGETSVTKAAALRGAIFSAVSDARYKRFVDSYEARFGAQPYRIATLGYDAVLLTLKVARDWKPGREFPLAALRSTEGYLGLDGAFRFGKSGVVDRAMEVREIRNGTVVVIDAAATKFD